MIVRSMEPHDVPFVIEFGRQWWRETYLGKRVQYDRMSVRDVIERSREEGLSIVAEHDFAMTGFVCGLKGPCLVNDRVTIGNEIFWWVHPDHRGAGVGRQLLSAIESAARTAGCTYWSMMSMQSHDPERADAIYTHAGYEWTERTYTKDLTGGSNDNRGGHRRVRGV